MTGERAKAFIRDRQRGGSGAVAPVSREDWHELAIAADALASRVYELDQELEREQARAGWPVLCSSPSRVIARNERPHDRMLLTDAVTVARNAIEDGTAMGAAPKDLMEAASALVAYVEEREADLARERSRVESAARPDAPRVEGQPIVGGRDAGGRRDFLGDEPVHAGTGLYLLMWKGWTAVRYESNGAGPSLVYLSLPGVGAEIPITIPPDARFAWQHEVRPRERN